MDRPYCFRGRRSPFVYCAKNRKTKTEISTRTAPEEFRTEPCYFQELDRQEGGSPEKELLANINFYIGNVSYYQSEKELSLHGRSGLWSSQIEAARTAYEDAIALTAHPIEIHKARFIEPLNNLGFVQNLSRKPQDAIASFERADTICRQHSSYNDVCTIVKYNLGDTKRKIGKHEEAIKLFAEALAELDNNPHASQCLKRRVFASILHQATAFSRVMIAAKSEGAYAEESYAKAGQELEKARLSLASVPNDPTVALLSNYNQITEARIQIGHAKWHDAIATLTSVQSRMNDPEINLLLSIAYSCHNQQNEAEANFAIFAQAGSSTFSSWLPCRTNIEATLFRMLSFFI